MNYFEVKGRLANLVKFRNLYSEYLSFINRDVNIPAQLVRSKMEPLTNLTVDSLRQVELGSMLTREAPAKGGRKVKINLIRAIFRDKIIRHFLLDEHAPLRILDQGVVRYKTLLWKQKVQLFNPLFWIFQMVIFLAELPIQMCRRAGYETQAIEQSRMMRVYIILFQVVLFYVIFKSFGIIDWLRFNLF